MTGLSVSIVAHSDTRESTSAYTEAIGLSELAADSTNEFEVSVAAVSLHQPVPNVELAPIHLQVTSSLVTHAIRKNVLDRRRAVAGLKVRKSSPLFSFAIHFPKGPGVDPPVKVWNFTPAPYWFKVTDKDFNKIRFKLKYINGANLNPANVALIFHVQAIVRLIEKKRK